jgi:hypothetical protein
MYHRHTVRLVVNGPASVRPSATTPGISRKTLRSCYGVVLLAAVAAAVLDSLVDVDIKIREQFSIFAVLYIVAQASERLVEPLMKNVAPQEVEHAKAAVKVTAKTRQAAVLAGNPEAAASSAAEESVAQKALDRIQGQRAVIAWAIASSFALIICGLLGLGLIEAVSTTDVTGFKEALFRRVDVIVTGLAIGAGTKPLHDLITRIEKSKSAADPAT